jgi:hypothetical protein
MMSLVAKLWLSLPPWIAVWLARLFSLVAGVVVAIILHYVLYRIGLPSTPFIYVAF